MTTRRLLLAAAAVLVLGVPTAPSASRPAPPPAPCPRCGWTPPASKRITTVKNVDQLEDAVSDARPGTTILLDDGVYRLRSMLDITTPGVVLRGRSGDPGRVVLRGESMTEGRVGVAISISAPDVTVADITVSDVGYHGVQIRGERAASRATLHDIHVIDTGQQLVKGSIANTHDAADDVLIACSVFEYRDHAPSDYTNGVDALAAKGWTVRDNRFERIRGPEKNRWASGPAILFWANSQDTIVERNVVIDSFRGIAFGLGPGVSNLARGGERVLDHQGGRIRYNVVANLNAWGDEGIEANSAPGAVIEHNTVFVEGALGWSISLRFPATDALVRNNLTNRRVALRNGGRGTIDGNVDGALRSWFASPDAGDFHLTDASPVTVRGGVGALELEPARGGR